MRSRRFRGRAHGKTNVVGPKLNAARGYATRFGYGKKPLDQVIADSIRKRLQQMQHRRCRDNFAAFPFCVGVARADPLATLEFRIFRNLRLLLWRTSDEKKPGVETPGRKRRRHPTTGESEVVSVEMQSIKIQQFWPRQALRFEIVQQRSTLSDSQRLRTARQQDARFFKQLTRGATDHCGLLLICAILDPRFSIAVLALAAGESIKAAEKRELCAALYPEDFGIR